MIFPVESERVIFIGLVAVANENACLYDEFSFVGIPKSDRRIESHFERTRIPFLS